MSCAENEEMPALVCGTQRGLSVGSTAFTGMFGRDTGEGLLCCCSQTLELPPTGDEAGLIFAVLPQAGKDLSLQASLPSVISYLCMIFRWIVMHYCFD